MKTSPSLIGTDPLKKHLDLCGQFGIGAAEAVNNFYSAGARFNLEASSSSDFRWFRGRGRSLQAVAEWLLQSNWNCADNFVIMSVR